MLSIKCIAVQSKPPTGAYPSENKSYLQSKTNQPTETLNPIINVERYHRQISYEAKYYNLK